MYLLGVPRIERDGETSVLRGKQPRLILAYLLLAGDRPVAADELADVLWADRRASHWEGALRGVLTKVRAFAAEAGVGVANVGRQYHLRTNGSLVDIRRVDELLSGDHVDEPGLREIVELLDAELLPGFDDDWLTPHRTRLDRLRRRAHRLLSTELTGQGRHDEAVGHAQAAVVDDPFDEESQRRLIEAHLAAGNRASALRAYGELRQLLADELGIGPAEPTEALYLAALAGEAHDPPLLTAVDRAFVGREAELTGLVTRWETARQGHPRVVAVHGPSGVGKTRLALELVRRAGPTHVLYGRSSELQQLSFEPLAEALGRHLALVAPDDLTDLVGPFADEVVAFAPAAVGLPHDRRAARLDRYDQARVFQAVGSVLGKIATEPTVLVVDDLHWADDATLELVGHVVAHLERARLLVVVTYRDEHEPSAAFARLLTEVHRVDGSWSVPLSGLSAPEVIQLLAGSGVDGANDLGPRLHRRTGGNPFYLDQVLALHDEAPERFDPSAVPDTVTELVRHQVAGLPSDARTAISVASVFGGTMERAAFERSVERAGASLDGIDDVVERRLLLDDDTGGYSFAHGIVRDVVYRQLARSRRRRLHLTVAEVLEVSGIEDAERAVATAYHYDLADDPGSAAAWLSATRRAADHAAGMRDHARAAALYGRALALIDRFGLDVESEAELRVGHGVALRDAGDPAAAVVSLETAMALARARGDGALFGRAVLELVARVWRGAAVDMLDEDRLALVDEAIERLPPSEHALLVELHATASVSLSLTEHLDRSRWHAQRAGALAEEAGRPDLLAATVESHRHLHPRPEEVELRLALTDELVGPSSDGLLPAARRGELHAQRLSDRIEQGDRAGADLELAALAGIAAELDDPVLTWVTETWRTLFTFLAGDQDAADAMSLAAIGDVDDVTMIGRMLNHGIQLVTWRLQQHRGAEVVHLLRSGIAMAPAIVGFGGVLALALAQAGEAAEAAALVAELAADDLAALREDVGWHLSVTMLSAACTEVGDAEAAAVLAPRLEPWTGRLVVLGAPGVGGACWGPYDAVLGGLWATVGDRRRARQAYDRAARVAEAFGAPVLIEQVAADRARWLG